MGERSSTRAFAWSDLPGYKGKSTNALIRERSFKDFLRRELPAAQIRTSDARRSTDGLQPLSDYAIEVLHGPPDPIQFAQDRYYVLRACRARSCSEKGLLVLDAREKKIASFTTWYYPTNVFSRRPSILVAANGGIKTDRDADDLLERLGPFVGRWLSDGRIEFGGFVIRADSGDSIFRPHYDADAGDDGARAEN